MIKYLITLFCLITVYNDSGDCDNGVYNVMTNYWADNLLQCGGRTETHPDNLDVNNPIIPFTNQEMELDCNCDNYPACLTVATAAADLVVDSNCLTLYPSPTNGVFKIQGDFNNYSIQILSSDGTIYQDISNQNSPIEIDLSMLSAGLYFVKVVNGQNNNICIQQMIKMN